MADYRLYILRADGHISRAIAIIADDDDQAIYEARDQLIGEPAELWSLARKVTTFDAETDRSRRYADRSGPDAKTA